MVMAMGRFRSRTTLRALALKALALITAMPDVGKANRASTIQTPQQGGSAMNAVTAAHAAGRPSFGAWITLGHHLSNEIMGAAGYDWVILDCQHGAIGWDQILPTVQVLALGGTRALVRPGWNDPTQIMRALDLGAMGVVVPMVSTAEDARRAAEACRYPPKGIRSFGQVRKPYLTEAGTLEESLCFVMIETAEAMDNLEAIAATPGVDGLFVGPVDLSLSLGLGSGIPMPEGIVAACEKVVAACERHDLIPGCAGLGPDNVQLLMDRGMKFLSIGSDAAGIRKAVAGDLELAKALQARFAARAKG
jgi:4-hydroxy-2-oxoheptanedioate aldolase